MTERVTIYGHEIELDEPEPDGVITDVVILYRTVFMDDHSDRVDMTPSNSTTGVIQTGMLHIAHTADLNRWTAQGGEIE